MTATTAHPAATEAEIREAFRDQWQRTGEIDLSDVLSDAGRAVDYVFDLDDFRDSETEALDAMLTAVRRAIAPKYDALARRYRDALEEVAVRFAAEHPDAPRAPREEVQS